MMVAVTGTASWQLTGPAGSMAEARLLDDAEAHWQAEWAAEIRDAERHLADGRPDDARHSQERAFRLARDRGTQGATLHHIARRWWRAGDLDRAATHFELARALRRGFAEPALTANTEGALAGLRRAADYDAVVLTGGAGRRVGYRDKAELPLAGWPLVDHVLLAVSGAARRIVVGPTRRGLAEPEFCREDPPGGGPVAAIRAAIEQVSATAVLLLAGDQPFIGAGIGPLRSSMQSSAADQSADVSVLVDVTGRVNYLAAYWRTEALRAALGDVGTVEGAPVRSLFQSARRLTVPDFEAASFDCDTLDDLRVAESRVRLPAGPAVSLRAGRNQAPLPEWPLAWRGLALHSPS